MVKLTMGGFKNASLHGAASGLEAECDKVVEILVGDLIHDTLPLLGRVVDLAALSLWLRFNPVDRMKVDDAFMNGPGEHALQCGDGVVFRRRPPGRFRFDPGVDVFGLEVFNFQPPRYRRDERLQVCSISLIGRFGSMFRTPFEIKGDQLFNGHGRHCQRLPISKQISTFLVGGFFVAAKGNLFAINLAIPGSGLLTPERLDFSAGHDCEPSVRNQNGTTESGLRFARWLPSSAMGGSLSLHFSLHEGDSRCETPNRN